MSKDAPVKDSEMSPVFTPPFGHPRSDNPQAQATGDEDPQPTATYEETTKPQRSYSDRQSQDNGSKYTPTAPHATRTPRRSNSQASLYDMHRYFTGDVEKTITWYRRLGLLSGIVVFAMIAVIVAMTIRLSKDRDRCANFAASDRALITSAISDPTSPNAWATVVPVDTAPSGRYYSAAAAVDAKMMFLYGGLSGSAVRSIAYNVLDDLWTFNEQTDLWTSISRNPASGGPTGRYLATLVTADDRMGNGFHHTLVLFGGFTGTAGTGSPVGDVWALDTRTHFWSQLAATGAGPSARGGHSSVGYNGVIYVHGGTNSITSTTGVHDEVWSFTIATRTWTLLPARTGVAASADLSVVGASWLFVPSAVTSSPNTVQLLTNGGANIWTFDIATSAWSASGAATTSTTATNGLCLGSGVVAGALGDGILFSFGGRPHADSTSVLLSSAVSEAPLRDELFAYDATTRTWSPLYPNYNRTTASSRPPGLAGQTTVRIGSRLLMFGGMEGSTGHPGSYALYKYQAINAAD